jgi:signal transduction histidine kinase
MSHLAEAKKITLTFKPATTLLPVRADELQLYRAIKEVIENALEYTPENGTLTVSTLRKVTYGIVEVQDTGIGIAADLMPHLFERFYHFNLVLTRFRGGRIRDPFRTKGRFQTPVGCGSPATNVTADDCKTLQ